MSTIGVGRPRGLAVERGVIRVGRALVAWGERREQQRHDSQGLYRRQAEAAEANEARNAAHRCQLLP